MMPVTPLVQFPWPLILGGGIGLALAVGVSLRSARGKGLPGALPALALAAAGASAGAFVALVWLWVVPMSNPFACLYSCDEAVQFLSNEQFQQIMLMSDLAWTLPAIALVSAAVAVAVRLSRRRASAGSR